MGWFDGSNVKGYTDSTIKYIDANIKYHRTQMSDDFIGEKTLKNLDGTETKILRGRSSWGKPCTIAILYTDKEMEERKTKGEI